MGQQPNKCGDAATFTELERFIHEVGDLGNASKVIVRKPRMPAQITG